MKARTTWAKQGAPDGATARRDGDEPEGGEQQLLLGQTFSQAPHEHEADDGPGAAARQDQSVPVQAHPVHTPQPEGEHEGHETGQAAHNAHGAQPEHHFGIGEGLQSQQVLLARDGLALLAVLAHLRRLVSPHLLGSAARQHRQPGAGHRGGDEHQGGEDEHGRRARDLVEDHGGNRRHEAGQGAEERQPRVERRVAGLFALRVRAVQRGHLRHQRALGHEVELLAHEHEKGEREEQEAVQMGGHERAQHHLPDGGRDDHERGAPRGCDR